MFHRCCTAKARASAFMYRYDEGKSPTALRCEHRREEAPWCDFAFEVAGERVTMHRAVMAARSPFMRRMLLTDWRLPVRTPRPCHGMACWPACGISWSLN